MFFFQLFFCIALAFSADQNIIVNEATIRLVPPVSTNTVGLMKVKNQTSKDLTLKGIESDISKKVELHLMKKVNGMMTMRPVDGVVIKKGEMVHLDGSYHVMFLGLKKPVKLDEKHKLTLVFSDGKKIVTEAVVTP